MCFIWLHVFTRTHLTPLQCASESVICLKSLPVCVLAHIYLCMQLVWPVCVHACVWCYTRLGNRLYSLCAARGFMAQGALSCDPDWERVWVVRGLGARDHTLLPTVRSSGQPVNAREAWSFCPSSGKVFHGLGVAAQSGRPERGRTSAHVGASVGQQRNPVGGKIVLTATQSGATPKRADMFREFANCIALNNCQGKMWVKVVFYFFVFNVLF